MNSGARTDHLTFLHLSDIHFVKDLSGESAYDLDSGIRHAIEQDAERMLEHVGKVDGILISGDIAFAGKVQEYETARTWLTKLANIVKCDPGYVWCVPGNHDVDQSVQKALPLLLDTYRGLRASKKRDDDFKDRLQGTQSGGLMFQPLKNYHEHFGVIYGCPTTHSRPFWEDDLFLNDESILRIRGINSSIISSREDHREGGRLIVGGAQIQYMPQSNVAYMTLCHHPTSWLVDEDEVYAAMVAHSQLQLFGHKHSHRHEKIKETLRLASGAVHPVRSEKEWDPRYYFLSLRVDVEGGLRQLVVRLFPRVWNKQSWTFTRDSGDFEGQYDTVRLLLPNWEAPSAAKKDSLAESTPTMPSGFDRKRLINRFMTLPFHSQLSIMSKFDLFTEDERKTIPDSELFLSCFRRAKDKNILDKVWEAIDVESRKGGE